MEAVIFGLWGIVSSVIPFVIIIGAVVTVHELGHYLAGRAFGAAVESFAFGFGDSIVETKDKRGTRWRLNWLPLGGFVKFVGEAQAPGDAGKVEQGPIGKPYTQLTAWQRVVVSFAGPFVNFVFAILIYACMAMATGEPKYGAIEISAIEDGGPADVAGIKTGDLILSVGGRSVEEIADFQNVIFYSANEAINVQIERAGTPLDLSVTPTERVHRDENLGIEEKIGYVGVGLRTQLLEVKPVGPVRALAIGVEETQKIIDLTVKVLTRLIQGKDSFEKMRGPLGIGDIADKVVDSHLKNDTLPFMERMQRATLHIIHFIALFSVSIGFFNLLPIPMLDGYSILLGTYEAIFGSEVSVRVQEFLLRGGLAVIGVFFIAVSWNDLKRLGLLEVFGRLLS